MARPLRITFDGAFHHVTNRGLRRQRIFIDDHDRRDFLRLLGRAHDRFDILINAYSLMGNHFHLVVETPQSNLSEAMHLLLGNYVQRFNLRHGFDGPLFKDRFYSKLIETDGYADRAVTYVHRNPLEAGIVEALDTYDWSSYGVFLGPKSQQPNWLSDRALRIGGIRTRARLRSITESGRSEHTIDPADYREVIGSDDFIAAALDSAPANRQTIGHVRSATPRPSVHLIESAVASGLGVPVADLWRNGSGKSTSTQPRMIAIGLCQDLGRVALADIADRYGYGSAQSAGAAASRFRGALAADVQLGIQVGRIRSQILKSQIE